MFQLLFEQGLDRRSAGVAADASCDRFNDCCRGRNKDDILGVIPPLNGIATVERVAANAVMAGCLPDYFPLVLAAVQA